MIRVQHIGTTTIQGPAHDMPRPFDPNTHAPNSRCAECDRPLCLADQWFDMPICARCAISAAPYADPYTPYRAYPLDDGGFAIADGGGWLYGSFVQREEPVPAARRSPLEHERDAGQVLDPASEVAWLRKIGINSAADLIEALVAEHSREFARGYELGRAVGAVGGEGGAA